MLNTSGEVLARSWRVAQIPNGNSFGCRTCHNASYSSLNSFGTDVLRIVGRGGRDRFWSQTLASKDSDGDGVPNGQELGDEDGDGFSTIESSGGQTQEIPTANQKTLFPQRMRVSRSQ